MLIITSQGKIELLFTQVTLLPRKMKDENGTLCSLKSNIIEAQEWMLGGGFQIFVQLSTQKQVDCRKPSKNNCHEMEFPTASYILNLQYTMVPSLFPSTSHPKRII